MPNPLPPQFGSVSVVVSTFNRPDALVAAIRSVFAQSYPVKEIIVVGDQCHESTARAVQDLRDSRIRYINLEKRHGDQSGPNGRGVVEATGEWVAFLNHDDFWYPEHLAVALHEIDRSSTQWFAGVANFSFVVRERNGGTWPVVTEVGLSRRSMPEAYGSTFRYMEPASAWVVSREKLLSAGNWPTAADSIRTPLSFLALRLWRRLGAPAWGSRPTVLKLHSGLHKNLGAHYTSPSVVHQTIGRAIAERPQDWWRDLEVGMTDHSSLAAPLEANFPDAGVEALPRSIRFGAAQLFRTTGFDLLGFRLGRHGVTKGHLMNRIMFDRTGEIRDSSGVRLPQNLSDQ